MKNVKNKIIGLLKFVIQISFILLLIFTFVWAGFKGLVMFIVGSGIVVYLFLSKNMVLMGLVDMCGSEEYINEILKK